MDNLRQVLDSISLSGDMLGLQDGSVDEAVLTSC